MPRDAPAPWPWGPEAGDLYVEPGTDLDRRLIAALDSHRRVEVDGAAGRLVGGRQLVRVALGCDRKRRQYVKYTVEFSE